MSEQEGNSEEKIAGGAWDDQGAFVIDDDDLEGFEEEAPQPKQSSRAPRKDTTSLEMELEQAKAALLRARADVENFRKRVDRDKAESFDRMAMDLLGDLLPILDNFERAIRSKLSSDFKSYAQGVEMIFRQMCDILGKKGVRRMQVEGIPFDPRVHEAVSAVESEGVTQDMVSQEIIPGYTYKYKVLRPAQVQVTKPKAREMGASEEDDEGAGPMDADASDDVRGMSVNDLQNMLDDAVGDVEEDA